MVLCEDAVCSFNLDLHEAALVVMRRRYEVMPAADVLDAWRAAARVKGVKAATARASS